MGKYRIMSLDGGSGAVTYVNCLIALETAQPGFVASTDMFVGSSAGSWVALYLARNMPLVDAGSITGLELLQGCYAFLTGAAKAMAPSGTSAYVDWVLGKGPLTDYSAVQALMQRKENYGPTTTLGDLKGARRAVVSAARMVAPWGPRVYDSADPADAGEYLFEVGLRSGSFPLVVPIRDGQVDGAMNTNNPAMIGMVRAMSGIGGAAPIAPGDIVLLTLGADDGSSKLSNVFIPEQPAKILGPAPYLLKTLFPKPPHDDYGGDLQPPPEDDVVGVLKYKTTKLLAHEYATSIKMEGIIAEMQGDSGPLISPTIHEALAGTMACLRDATLTSLKQLDAGPPEGPPVDEPKLNVMSPANSDWGWPPWLAYPLNLLFLLQVMLNSEGRGVADQCAVLLGARTFRLAPVGLLPSNVGFLLSILGMNDLLISFCELTAEQWSTVKPPWVVSLYGFSPSSTDANAWVAAQWV